MTGYKKIAIFFLSFFFLFPLTSVKAVDYYCGCISGRNCIPGAAITELDCQNECANAVNNLGEHLYSGNTWFPNAGACGTAVMSPAATTTIPATTVSPGSALVPILGSTTYEKPVLSVNIPTVSFSEVISENGYLEINWLGEYINGLYQFLLSIGGIFAVLMIMIGGIQYVISRGGGEMSEAKKRMTNALTGLVLLFSVFIILSTVSPGLISFDALNIKIQSGIAYESAVTTFADNGPCSAGESLFGISTQQDCLLNTFGKTEAEVAARLKPVTFRGRTYMVHELVVEDYQKAFDAIDATRTTYDLTRSSAGGTFNWRCNKNSQKYLSPHAFGIALDINPDTNPNCKAECRPDNWGSMTEEERSQTPCSCIGGDDCATVCRSAAPYDIPIGFIQIFKDSGIRWGGEWNNVKDWMHFQSQKYCF
ncbi:MAG: M15 family metallopeptidase [Candidatus Uhrbacteria bacterium]